MDCEVGYGLVDISPYHLHCPRWWWHNHKKIRIRILYFIELIELNKKRYLFNIFDNRFDESSDDEDDQLDRFFKDNKTDSHMVSPPPKKVTQKARLKTPSTDADSSFDDSIPNHDDAGELQVSSPTSKTQKRLIDSESDRWVMVNQIHAGSTIISYTIHLHIYPLYIDKHIGYTSFMQDFDGRLKIKPPPW